MEQDIQSTSPKYPEWVLKHKKPGTEVRVVKGHYLKKRKLFLRFIF